MHSGSIALFEFLALAGVFALGYYMVLDQEPSYWWRERLDDWMAFCHSKFGFNQNLLYLFAVGIPAMAVGVLDAVVGIPLFHFFLCAVTLLAALAVGPMRRYLSALIKAVYANDEKLATQLANEWEKRGDGLEESRERFVVRMLSLPALRLHEDIFSILLWYVLLGPAGVVLITVNNALFRQQWAKPLRLNPLDWVSERYSCLLFVLCGSSERIWAAYGDKKKTLGLLGLRPERAALAAGGIDEEKISLEAVPGYGKFLIRTMFINAIFVTLSFL